MPGSVILQSDVGNLGIQGLGAFTNILATLSADIVTPMAMVQMEKLGATLPVSGKQAERVKGLLQRCNNVRLDRIALAIGWRKNDSASAMAQSAGGQAIALLSMCLTNLYKPADTGTILSRLCSKLCAASANVSSIRQLADVATLLGGKVDALGFGNLLAHEVMRIQETYATLGYSLAPPYLVESLSIEVITDILESVSRALLQENQICRISGSYGMGHVVGMLQVLFPRDTSLTIEGIVMQDVEHPKIRCEIHHSKREKIIRIHVETIVSHTMPVSLPITHRSPVDRHQDHLYIHCNSYSYLWSGWLAEYSRLIFTAHGLILDRSILEACCDLLIYLPASIAISVTSTASKQAATLSLALLGPFPRERMCSNLHIVFGCSPTEHHLDLQSAFENLTTTLDHHTAGGLSCQCLTQGKPCDWNDIYKRHKGRTSIEGCFKGSLIVAMRKILDLGLLSLFVKSEPNATIRPLEFDIELHLEEAFAKPPARCRWLSDDFLDNIHSMVHKTKNSQIATSCGSSTIYPSILTNLRMPSCQSVTFSLVDGLIVYEQRYHTDLLSANNDRCRYIGRDRWVGDIVPSHTGVHSGSPLLTIRETFDWLELHCSVQCAGFENKIDLRDVIRGFIGLHWPGMCSHAFDTPLNVEKYPAVATDVVAPAGVAEPAAKPHLGIAMTRGSPTAQLLCCQEGVPAILQRGCCLNCAAEALGDDSEGVIIVG